MQGFLFAVLDYFIYYHSMSSHIALSLTIFAPAAYEACAA